VDEGPAGFCAEEEKGGLAPHGGFFGCKDKSAWIRRKTPGERWPFSGKEWCQHPCKNHNPHNYDYHQICADDGTNAAGWLASTRSTSGREHLE